MGIVLHSAIFQIVANNFLEVLLRSYWHVAGFVILSDNYKIPLIVIQAAFSFLLQAIEECFLDVFKIYFPAVPSS